MKNKKEVEVRKFAECADCNRWNDFVAEIKKGTSVADAGQSACQGCLACNDPRPIDIIVEGK